MTDLGYIAFVLALVTALYGAVVSVMGARRNVAELVNSGRNAVYAAAALVLLASLLLWRALLTDQFQLEYVATHSERSLPFYYKLSAFWGGQAGSLTFWTLLLCVVAVVATWSFRNQQPGLRPYINATFLVNIAFFCCVVVLRGQPVCAPVA